jgi:hypothetical protein
VAGAELGHLAHELQVRCADCRFDLLGAVAGDDHAAVCPQAGGGLQNMLQ